jgi:cobalt/nickel transport system ATP-binding protein
VNGAPHSGPPRGDHAPEVGAPHGGPSDGERSHGAASHSATLDIGPPQPQDVAASISCVKHRYEDGSKVELCGLDFVVGRGRRVVLLGPNGSGKTTLLFHLVGILRPSEGSVSVMGIDPAHDFARVRRRIGVVLQNVDEQLLAPTVWDDVSFSPRQYGLSKEEVRDRTERALELLGIGHLRDKVPHYLSGGEKRKVAIAGALVLDPELLILDEPFEGLDPRARRQVLDLLNRQVAERGMTMIISTHDVNSVPEMADEVYVLAHGGHIVLRGSPRDIFLRADLLRESNIEPPVLSQLFENLARRTGRELPAPATIAEAADELARLATEDGGLWGRRPAAP